MNLLSRSGHLIDTNYGTARGLVRSALGQLEFVLGRVDAFIQPALPDVDRLVFVCLGNINRSAFGQSVATQLGVRTCSIGLATTTGAPAFHKAITTADWLGFDLTGHRATDITDYNFRPTDLLLAMEVRHARHLVAHGYPASSVALLGHWASPHRIHLHDPHVLSDDYFRTCFSLIHSAVHGLTRDLAAAGSRCMNP